MSEVQNKFIPSEVLKSLSGRSLIKVPDLAAQMKITIPAVVDLCLHGELPLYVMWNKDWRFNLIAGDPPILNEDEETFSYSLLRVGALDIAMILANGSAEISELTDQYGCLLSVVGVESNGQLNPVKSLTISANEMLIRYSELSQAVEPTELGKTEKENLLKSIAALAYTAVSFYEKTSANDELGTSENVKVHPLVEQIHACLSANGFSLSGIGESALEKRISDGLKLLKRE